jgi:outer membrane receptor protein involved in Fe transport
MGGLLPLGAAVAADASQSAAQSTSTNPSPALAAPAPSANGSSMEEDRGQLEEVTVTATRRSESLEKVPISINALTQQDMADAQIKNISDIAAVTPGLTFQLDGFSSTLTVISMRGLESLFGASTVGVYLDDTPIQSRLSSDGNIGNPYPAVFDLNRVEVERGPQGTLFGAGSEAGTVRFISNEPSLTEFSGYTHGELSSTQNGALSHEIGAAAGGPIVNDEVGFRVSVWDRTNGGYLDQVTPWNGDTVARDTNKDETLATKVAFTFKVNDDMRITPSVFYQNIDGYGNSRFDPNFSNPSQGIFSSVTLLPETWSDHFVVPSIKLEDHLSFADLTAIASYTNRSALLENDLSGLLGAIGLVNYGNPLGPSYASSQSDVSPFYTATSVRAFTEEVRLASNNRDAFFTWVAGLFNDHRTQVDSQLEYSLLVDPTGKEIFYTLQTVTDDQIAAFAQGDFHLTSQWTVTLGERVARVKTEQSNVNGTGALDAVPPYAESSLSQTPQTPHGSLSFQVDRNNLLYATVSRGFRVGGANDPLPAVCDYTAVPKSYTADFVTNYEVGAKDLLFDGRMKIDTSIFHIVWSNIQQLAQPACGISFTFNGGGAVSNGFDLALEGLVTSRLKLDLDVGYSNAYFTSNVYDSNGHILVSSGDKIGYLPFVSPPWDVNASANYEIPLRDAEKLRLRIEYQYRSHNPGPFITQNPLSPNYAPQEAADPATQLWNAKAGLTLGKVDLDLFVNNLFNAHPLLDKYGQAVLSAPTYSTFRPRTLGVSATVPF